MAYMDGPRYCSIEEYNAGRSSRLICEQLKIGEIYTLMAAGRDKGREARYKTPGSVLEVKALKAGIYLVSFCALDEDLREYHRASAEFSNGFLVRDLDDLEPGEEPLREAYFRSYRDDFDGFIRDISTTQNRELVISH